MVGLAGMVGADAGLNGEMGGCRKRVHAGSGARFWWPSGAASPPYWGATIERARGDEGGSAESADYRRRRGGDAGLGLSREEFIGDRDWYASYDYLKVQQPLGADARMWGFRAAPGASGRGGVVLREAGRSDFSARDRSLVREAHAAIAPQVGRGLAGAVEPSPRGLTPRVRRVLACLLEGDGDKQVAGRLGIGVHTVNQHTKVIYRHFVVRSRPELLARWVRRGWGGGCPWADDDGPAGEAG